MRGNAARARERAAHVESVVRPELERRAVASAESSAERRPIRSVPLRDLVHRDAARRREFAARVKAGSEGRATAHRFQIPDVSVEPRLSNRRVPAGK